MDSIPCSLCGSLTDEFFTIQVSVPGLGNLAVHFCTDDFDLLTPRLIELGYLPSSSQIEEGSQKRKEEDRMTTNSMRSFQFPPS